MEAEGKDRESLDLPGHQNDLLRDAYTYGKEFTCCRPGREIVLNA